MDEYITRNNVISAVCFGCNQEFSDEPCEPSQCAIRQSIMALPTADVVPKSEVEDYKHNWQKIHDSYNADCLEHYNKGQQDAAREIFEEIEEYAELQIESLNIAEKLDSSGADFFGGGKQAFVLLLDRLAELKKKYPGGE